MKAKTTIQISFSNEEAASRTFEAADGMIRIAYSPEPYNGTVLTEDGDIRNMRLGERFLYFGRKVRKYDPLADHPDCALSSMTLKGRILTLEDCSDLQGAMNIGLACESEFFLQLLFTAALLAPEADFEGFCHYEDPVSGRREKTQALCKDGYIALEQTRSNPPEGSPSPFIPEKAAWILKDKRFIRTDVR